MCANASAINTILYENVCQNREQTNENDNMLEIEKQRLEDFKRVLTYRLVTKIHHDFKDNYKLYYSAPSLWTQWRNRKLDYDNRIYKLIILFNQTALSAHQVQSIFGKNDENDWIAYANLIAQDDSIKVFNKGTVCMNKRRFQIKKRYQLPIKFIASIFENKELLDKVLNAGSGFYTPRQRRLIFTQINNMKRNYHYKTNKEVFKEKTIEQQMKELEDII